MNTVVGTVAATDADGDTLSYALTGTDASSFSIDSDGEITVATELTNSDSYSFNVVADDGTDTTRVVVTVTAIAISATGTIPQSLAVTFPSATTALLKWSQPTNLTGTLETYEVNPNSDGYVDVESQSGRYLVRGLDRGANQSFDVRAKRADGTYGSEATITGTTPIASLHNSLFFRDCRNLLDDGTRITEHGVSTNILREIADNDLETFSTETDIDINISDGSDPTRVHAIYTITEGVDSHVGVATGGVGTGWASRTIPDTITNWEGTDVSTVVNGKQHDLYLLSNSFTATSAQVTFTGTNVKVYEVYLLGFGLEIDANGDFTEISPDKVNRNFVLHESVDGSVQREVGLGGRDRWETTFLAKFVIGNTEIENSDTFLYWVENNKNCFFFQEFSRYPARGYPAAFGDARLPVRLRGDRSKLLGDIVRFRVLER